MTPTTKPFWQSKTVWVQVLAILSTFIPAVEEWVKSNPVEFVAALAALNTLVRFATHGSLAIFQDDSDSHSGGNSSGTGSGWSLLLAMTATAAGLSMAGGLLSSCVVGVDERGGWSVRPDPLTVDAGLKYLIRHEGDAKSGLTEWEYFDPATGEKIKPEDYAAWGITAGAGE